MSTYYRACFMSKNGQYVFDGVYEAPSPDNAVSQAMHVRLENKQWAVTKAREVGGHWVVEEFGICTPLTVDEAEEYGYDEVWDFCPICKYNSVWDMVRPLREDEFMRHIGAPALLEETRP